MSRRWRREMSRQPVRDDADRERIEALIAEAAAEDARKALLTARDARTYEGPKKDHQKGWTSIQR